MPRVLPAALGAVDTTVMREAGAYASLDEGGHEVIPTLIDSVQDPDGHVVWRPSAIDLRRLLRPGRATALTDERKADRRSGVGIPACDHDAGRDDSAAPACRLWPGLSHPIAGKTGTTQDFTDAWFSGFTPDLVTTVWVGFDNPATLGDNETGAAVAGPIWHDFMAVALKNRPVLNFPQPHGCDDGAVGYGLGVVTDAFKPDQVPGASHPIGSAVATTPADSDGTTPADAAQTVHGGVDSSLGGIVLAAPSSGSWVNHVQPNPMP